MDDATGTTATAEMVRISKFGSDEKTVDYTAGATIGDYLSRADVTVDEGQFITMNTEVANVDTVVPSGAVVVIAGKIDNG